MSHLFEKLADWQAILIEADLQNFGKMRRQRDQAININAALCNASSTLHYIPHKGTTGGIFEFMSSTYLQSWQSELVGPDKEKHLPALLLIQCVRISDLFRNIGIFHVDLWILDVEGAELSALQGVDWDRVSISTIIMETDGGDEAKDAAKLSLLKTKGYTCVRSKSDSLCSHSTFVPSLKTSPREFRGRGVTVRTSGSS